MGKTRTVLGALATLAIDTLMHESSSASAPASRTSCEPVGTRAGWVVEVSIRAARACCRP